MSRVEIDLGTLTNSCFVIMPFSPTYQKEYEGIIRPAVEDAGLVPIRADEIYSKPQVMADIWKCLKCAKIVIAELTGRNTNVFYEVGLAHALGKPVIIITRNQDDVPFDLKALRYLYYNTEDPFWGENLRKALSGMLRKLLKEEEYGTVFRGIAVKGKAKYKERPIPPQKVEAKPSHDITGVWEGTMEIKDASYNLNLHLIQTRGKFSGTLIVSYTENSQLTVVQQTMAGKIENARVRLYGTAYSFLQQGESSGYTLDNFLLRISPKGRRMSGAVKSDGGLGKALLKRKALKIPE